MKARRVALCAFANRVEQAWRGGGLVRDDEDAGRL
jgi:hypothetical protein